MRFTLTEILLLALTVLGLLTGVVQGVIIYKLSKLIKPEKNDLPDFIDEEKFLKSASFIEKLKFKFDADPQKFMKTSLFVMFIALTLAIPGVNTLYDKYIHEPEMRISYPLNGQGVDSVFTVKGEFKNVVQFEQVAYIAVFAPSENKYYIYGNKAEMDFDSLKWVISNAAILNKNLKGKQVKLLVLLVDKELKAYDDIVDYVAEGKGRPMEKLPDGCRVKDEISVNVK